MIPLIPTPIPPCYFKERIAKQPPLKERVKSGKRLEAQ